MGGLETMSYGLIPFNNRSLGLSDVIKDVVNGFVIDEPLPQNSISTLERAKALSSDEVRDIIERNFDMCDTYSWSETI